MTGVELIAEERKRQVEVEMWTPEHDQEHDQAEMVWAAITYAIPEEEMEFGDDKDIINAVRVKIKRYTLWPWNRKWWRPNPKDRVRELTKAGALIAAEIDRLQNLKK